MRLRVQRDENVFDMTFDAQVGHHFQLGFDDFAVASRRNI